MAHCDSQIEDFQIAEMRAHPGPEFIAHIMMLDHKADAYRSIMSCVGGTGLTAVMKPTQLGPRDQVQILRLYIDELRYAAQDA
jgi:hypothetical protein